MSSFNRRYFDHQVRVRDRVQRNLTDITTQILSDRLAAARATDEIFEMGELMGRSLRSAIAGGTDTREITEEVVEGFQEGLISDRG